MRCLHLFLTHFTSLRGINVRILVVGASGHLGSYVVEQLLKSDIDVITLVRPQSDPWRLTGVLDRVTVLRGDLNDLANTAGDIAAVCADTIIHLGWQGVTASERNNPEQITRNVSNTLALFELARVAGCRNWIGVGSQAEYGPYNGVLTEGLPLCPVTAYGTAKMAIELLTEKLCGISGMRWVWFRLLAIYGPKDDERHLIPSVTNALLRGEKPSLTLGEQQWDYLYVTDAARALVQMALYPEVCGIFNLASGEAYSVREIVERTRDLIDPALPLGFGEKPYPPDQPMHLQASVDRLRKATGWQPQVSLQDGLANTVEWYRARSIGGESAQGRQAI